MRGIRFRCAIKIKKGKSKQDALRILKATVTLTATLQEKASQDSILVNNLSPTP